MRADPFTLEDVAATVSAGPDALVAEIERAGYSGGKATGAFRIGNLTGKPQPMSLALEAQGISIERFFGDIGLKGTGLSGSAAATPRPVITAEPTSTAATLVASAMSGISSEPTE